MGRILELIPGSDGKVRSVKLKRADGDIAHHSLNHLFPMELALTHDHVATAPDHSFDQETSQNTNLVVPSDSLLDMQVTGGNSFPPDNLGSQVVVSPDMQVRHVQPFIRTSVEDRVDQAESGADSYLVDDQVIDHYSYIENLDPVHDQDLNLVHNSLDEDHEVADLPLRRPRRAATLRGRPLDDQFIYY